jgi:hypothetical protein
MARGASSARPVFGGRRDNSTVTHDRAATIEGSIRSGRAATSARARIIGTGKGSRVPVRMRTANLWTLERGKVVRHVGYPDASEALEAAGLSE